MKLDAWGLRRFRVGNGGISLRAILGASVLTAIHSLIQMNISSAHEVHYESSCAVSPHRKLLSDAPYYPESVQS